MKTVSRPRSAFLRRCSYRRGRRHRLLIDVITLEYVLSFLLYSDYDYRHDVASLNFSIIKICFMYVNQSVVFNVTSSQRACSEKRKTVI